MRGPRRVSRALGVLGTAAALALVACGGDDAGGGGGGGGDKEVKGVDLGETSKFFDQAEYERQLAARDQEPEGAADEPWTQAIEPEPVATTRYKTDGPWDVCFSNASVDNPWRQVGYKTMRAEVALQDDIGRFTVVDAEAKDDKQISDIEGLVAGGRCDALIVSPNTTATLTPAVEAACEELPVIVFDRGVNTECPVTFIKPIGGYAFGADGAEFLRDQVEDDGKILALRILPGVDVLETRWEAAKRVFEEGQNTVVGVEFTDGDPAKTKTIVSDYLQRFGTIEGVWMDAGATSVAAIEAFEDAGQDVPPITGEDQQDFLRKWKEDGLDAVAPTYPTYQWRTPVIAATQILSGEEVPKEWNLPQPAITSENLDEYLQPNMPPLHYALCGCEDMPGFPERWGGKAG